MLSKSESVVQRCIASNKSHHEISVITPGIDNPRESFVIHVSIQKKPRTAVK